MTLFNENDIRPSSVNFQGEPEAITKTRETIEDLERPGFIDTAKAFFSRYNNF